jgi:hypothetical protein
MAESFRDRQTARPDSNHFGKRAWQRPPKYRCQRKGVKVKLAHRINSTYFDLLQRIPGALAPVEDEGSSRRTGRQLLAQRTSARVSWNVPADFPPKPDGTT